MTSTIAGWLCLLVAATTFVQQGDFPDFKTGRYEVSFKESSPDAVPVELARRLNMDQEPPEYDIAAEKFQVWVPKAYAHDREWGLFVWIDAGDMPQIPEDWEKILSEHKLLAIAAHHSGNQRNLSLRVRLAVDAAFNMRRRFNIAPRRIYVSGVSGGGRVASMVGITYADRFAGTFPVVGVNFYKPVPAFEGGYYPPSFVPGARVLAEAKKRSRFVLLTGSKDFNRDNTKAVYRRGFKAEGFRHVLYLEVPGMGHSRPSGEWFDKGLDFLDQDDPPPKAKAKPSRQAD
jgi:hypothetical protein